MSFLDLFFSFISFKILSIFQLFRRAWEPAILNWWDFQLKYSFCEFCLVTSMASNTWFLSLAFSVSGSWSYGTSSCHHFAHVFLFSHSSCTLLDISSTISVVMLSHFSNASYTRLSATFAASRFSCCQSLGKFSKVVFAISTWVCQSCCCIHAWSVVVFTLGS